MPLPIVTDQFAVRWLREEDAPVLHRALFADAEVLKYLPPVMAADTAERTERRVARWIRSREEDGFGWAVVEAADTGEFLGLCGLLGLPAEPGAVELATLLARAAWGRRLGPNVSAAMIDWLFAETDVQRVVCFIHPDNVASRRAARPHRPRRGRTDDLPRRAGPALHPRRTAFRWRKRGDSTREEWLSPDIPGLYVGGQGGT